MKGGRTIFNLMVAHRVLAVVADLPQADRLVGAAILAHFNVKTGRCDPGADTLVRKLRMRRQIVFAAIGRLVQAGFFERSTHGGRSHRNAYRPVWETFCNMNTRAPSGKPCPIGHGEPCPMGHTNDKSLNEETPSLTLPMSRGATDREDQAKRDRRHSIGGGQSLPSHQQVAENKAQHRWETSLRLTLEGAYPDAVAAIDDTLRAAATAAEMQRCGAGLRVVLERLPAAMLAKRKDVEVGAIAKAARAICAELRPDHSAITETMGETRWP